ncbi:MAG: tol-pal system-associated acyl-CoA thioesterase [Legionella sp.]|nr:MAG: tol-pal system-associated acyl-CoA thioesterase [Legionella sp.]PJD98923.1 MAG: tol-pal system-associated acyl-CoA thioesterase [Legionella sp.]
MSIFGDYQHTVRVYTEDVDYMGIVYHANYLRYLERSRTEVLRSKELLLSELNQQQILFAIAQLQLQFKAPARLDDLLTIKTSVKQIKNCSFIMEQIIINQHNTVICKAEVSVVCVNTDLKPIRLPLVFDKKNC